MDPCLFWAGGEAIDVWMIESIFTSNTPIERLKTEAFRSFLTELDFVICSFSLFPFF